MPIRSDWKLAREGITADTLGHLVRRTLLNPTLTLPLILLARYTQQGRIIAQGHTTALGHLKTLLYLGLAKRVTEFLGDAVFNNWTNDVYDWKKEVVVVTGGSDGIGAIVVKLLAERGIKVVVLDVQPLTFHAPPTVQFFKCDLASTTSIATAASSIRTSLGNPTVLINNAGCARGKSILDSTESDIRLTFNVNSLSHYFLSQQFLPSMIKKNHGMIVTVASYAAYVTAPQMVDYGASKAAALAFHEGLTAELSTLYNAPKVRTVLMAQGYTRTKLFEGFGGSSLYPETVAEEIVKAVLGGKSKHILLPAAGWYTVAQIRGYPVWMQYSLRKRLDKLMKGWRGRQVVQPSMTVEKKEGRMEESGVLVGEKENA
ncbi:NAD(P)-binding protein [Delitschia confertaspora ATCC 74209]|uniref:Short-chain dehydrogenase/reductase 3 n=1 Tax=Delitschia confertaspora ATCC 74209 TaxID=1513339 RepID=A0A9P4MPY1_9PLEO|nr:NAD(P)-binding protein [Delitschia confertaspora ATCC 74209]